MFQTIESSAKEFLGKGNSATLAASVVCLHFVKVAPLVQGIKCLPTILQLLDLFCFPAEFC